MRLASVKLKCHPKIKKLLLAKAKEDNTSISLVVNQAMCHGFSNVLGVDIKDSFFSFPSTAKGTPKTKRKKSKSGITRFREELFNKAQQVEAMIKYFSSFASPPAVFDKALSCLAATDLHLTTTGYSYDVHSLVDYMHSCLLTTTEPKEALEALYSGLVKWDQHEETPSSLTTPNLLSLIFSYCSDAFYTWYNQLPKEKKVISVSECSVKEKQMKKRWENKFKEGFGHGSKIQKGS